MHGQSLTESQRSLASDRRSSESSIPQLGASIFRGIAALILLMSTNAFAPGEATAQLLPSHGGDRSGTSGFQFLKITVDPRGAAMGETVAANAFDASALYWNPALAAQPERMQIGFSHTAYYADVAVYYAAAYRRVGGVTLGASLQALDSGEMEVTTEFSPLGTGETFRFTDLGLGLTVAQQLTDLFSYGVTARLIRESTADITTATGLFDVGVFYRVGETGAQMAVSIRNFGIDGTPTGELERVVLEDEGTVVESEFESITPPTIFHLGVSYNAFRNDPNNALLISGQLNNPNDNAENFNVGIEYTWSRMLALRAGYRFGIEEYSVPSFGAGFIVPGLGGTADVRFDYAFTQLDRLGNVHRVGVNLGL